MIARIALLTACLAVGMMALAIIGRVHDWSPFGLVLAGGVAGAVFVMVGVAVYLDEGDL